jgi:hypothetical protein
VPDTSDGGVAGGWAIERYERFTAAVIAGD